MLYGRLGSMTMEEPPFSTTEFPALSDRDLEVLSLLGEKDDSHVAFQGMKRRLGLHQESLARTLRRLQDDRLIERSSQGYQLSLRGLHLAQALREQASTPSLPVLRTVLPDRHEALQAAEALRQRWFGQLRWYGHSEDVRGVTLSWTTEDGAIHLDARFEGILFSVDARLADPSRIPEAILAAHRLLYEVMQAYVGAGQRALPAPDS